MRVKFSEIGQQRRFLDFVKQRTKISLRKIARKKSFDYELLKKYYSERCLMSKEVFIKLCLITGIKAREMDVTYLDEYWGQAKGGRS